MEPLNSQTVEMSGAQEMRARGFFDIMVIRLKNLVKKQSFLVWLVTLATLGSGIVTINSVIGPSLPERHAILKEFFPLEFLHLSRFVTLLIGFALVISSINIFRRKRRAFYSVAILAALSIIFHLTKGLDYEEATLSLVLLVILFISRRNFTVKSSIPQLHLTVLRLIIAGVVAFGYSVAGFWLLDRRDFGINFTIKDSIHRTLSYLTLAGDPQLVPHTHYAHWFINSLYFITVVAIVYSIYTLFRPVIYRFRTVTRDREAASEIVAKHGRSAQDYFKTWPDKSYFFSESHNCFVAYRVGGSFAIALGDPVGPEVEFEEIIRNFTEFCQDNAWGMGFHQVLPDFLPLYKRQGFKKLKIGDDAIVDLVNFTLQGRGMKEIRHTVNQLEKMGVASIVYEPPIPDEVIKQVKEVSDEWLRIPGRRERAFTLGRFETKYIQSTPLFAAADKDGRILAFVNLIPSYAKGEATHDLMRRRIEAPNGIMDFLFVKLFLHEREKSYTRFNLGMAPMAGFQEKEEASPEERAIHSFFQRLNFLFSYEGLRHYKAKFATSWEPRYAVYRNVFDLPRFARALSRVSELKRKGGT